MGYGLASVCWSVMGQGQKLMGRHSSSPLPRFCANVVMMQKSLYLVGRVLSFPSSPALRPLTCLAEGSCMGWVPGAIVRESPSSRAL